MSTCPEADIHSIYLDNELPAAYVADYEAHVASCPECSARLERLKTVHRAMAQDAGSMELSQHDIDAGFDRLSSRLSYSRHVKSRNVLSFGARQVLYAVAGAAAALAIFVVPAQFSKKSDSSAAVASQIPQLEQAYKVSYPASLPIHMDGEINREALDSLFADGELVDTDVGTGLISPQIGTLGYASTGITAAGITPAAFGGIGYSAPEVTTIGMRQFSPNSMVFQINGQDIFSFKPVIEKVQDSDGDTVDGNAFSVEFSFGKFYFKPQDGGK